MTRVRKFGIRDAARQLFQDPLRISSVISWSAKAVIYDNAINITGNCHLARSEDVGFLAPG